MFAKLKLPPGVFRNGTKYQSAGRWWLANLVRWTEGAMQPIGGWVGLQDADSDDVDVTDPVRGLFGWKNSSGGPYLAIGTYNKAYAFGGGALTEITPASGFTAGAEDAASTVGGYDKGNYDVGLYGTGGGGAGGSVTEANSWQFDNFGEILIACAYADGKILYWDLNVSNDLAVVDAGAPTGCKGVVVTPERFVVALASDSDGKQLHWSDQEDYTEWDPLAAGSQAGDFILPGSGEIMCGRRMNNETLIWTDVDLFAMRYIGGVLVYSFTQVGSNCGIVSRRAVATVAGRAYWMSKKGFYTYDGFAKPIPCEIGDEIFPNLNDFQASKIAAWPVSEFNEIWFTYPSAGSSECNKVVTYNYLENHWSGPWDLKRTDGVDRGAWPSVVAADTEGVLQQHETGEAYLDVDGSTALVPAAETGPVELGGGDRVMTVREYIPDEDTAGDVGATLYAGFYPTDNTEDSQTITVGQRSDVRLTGRQVRLRIAQANAGWRFGIARLEVVPRGRR